MMHLFGSAGKAEAMKHPIVMPHLGATGGDVKIVEWLVAEGQSGEGRRRRSSSSRPTSRRARSRRFATASSTSIVSAAGSECAPGDVSRSSSDEPLQVTSDAEALRRRRRREPRASPSGASDRRKRPPAAPLAERKDNTGTATVDAGLLRGSARRGVPHDGAHPPLRGAPLSSVPAGPRAGHAASVPGAGSGRGRRLLGAPARRCHLQHPPPGRASDRQGRFARTPSPPRSGARRPAASAARAGQMHLADFSVGAMVSNAIVGANIPIATGSAMAFRLQGLDRVAVSFFGDGASNIGAFHEGLNLAAVQRAPVVFVCENNLYAASTHVSTTMRISRHRRPRGGLRHAGDRRRRHGRRGRLSRRGQRQSTGRGAGDGPTLIECKTYRYRGHSRGDPGGYRTTEGTSRMGRRAIRSSGCAPGSRAISA